MSKSKTQRLVSRARAFAKANQREQLARFHEEPPKQVEAAQKKADETAQALIDFAAESFQ